MLHIDTFLLSSSKNKTYYKFYSLVTKVIKLECPLYLLIYKNKL